MIPIPTPPILSDTPNILSLIKLFFSIRCAITGVINPIPCLPSSPSLYVSPGVLFRLQQILILSVQSLASQCPLPIVTHTASSSLPRNVDTFIFAILRFFRCCFRNPMKNPVTYLEILNRNPRILCALCLFEGCWWLRAFPDIFSNALHEQEKFHL